MSAIGKFLTDHLQKTATPGYDLAARMGLDRTHFSHFIRGKRTSCNIETLAKMVEGISEEPAVRAGLLEAYFRDQALPEMKDWVSVSPPNRTFESSPLYRADDIDQLAKLLRKLDLQPEVIQALRTLIGLMPEHDALQDLVKELAGFAADALQPPEEGKKTKVWETKPKFTRSAKGSA